MHAVPLHLLCWGFQDSNDALCIRVPKRRREQPPICHGPLHHPKHRTRMQGMLGSQVVVKVPFLNDFGLRTFSNEMFVNEK